MRKTLTMLVLLLLLVGAGAQARTYYDEPVGLIKTPNFITILINKIFQPMTTIETGLNKPSGWGACTYSPPEKTFNSGERTTISLGNICAANSMVRLYRCEDNTLNCPVNQQLFEGEAYKIDGVLPRFTNFLTNRFYNYKCYTCEVEGQEQCTGGQRCNGIYREACIEGVWERGENCQMQGKICQERAGGYTDCVSQNQEECAGSVLRCVGDWTQKCIGGYWYDFFDCSPKDCVEEGTLAFCQGVIESQNPNAKYCIIGADNEGYGGECQLCNSGYSSASECLSQIRKRSSGGSGGGGGGYEGVECLEEGSVFGVGRLSIPFILDVPIGNKNFNVYTSKVGVCCDGLKPHDTGDNEEVYLLGAKATVSIYECTESKGFCDYMSWAPEGLLGFDQCTAGTIIAFLGFIFLMMFVGKATK